MKRELVLPFTAQLETCTVMMEACCGAHHLEPATPMGAREREYLHRENINGLRNQATALK